MMRNVSKLSFIAALLGAVACNSSPSSVPPAPASDAPAPAEAPKAEAAEPKSEEAKAAATDLEHSGLADAEVPFVLTLETTPKEPPDRGVVSIVARIEAHQAFSTPTKIEIALPPSAKLIDGQAAETLADLPAGTTTRTFKVQLSERLSDPIKVSVGMVDPHGRFGAHATRIFPEAEPPAPVRTSRVPTPPVGRPGQGLSPRTPGATPGAGPTQPGTR